MHQAEWYAWLQHNYWAIGILIVWVASAVVSLSSQDANPFRGLRWELARPPLDALKGLFDKVKELVGPDGIQEGVLLSEAPNTVKEITKSVKLVSHRASTRLGDHMKEVFMVIANEEQEASTALPGQKIWRTFGAVLSLILLTLFIYADTVQGINNVSMLFPNEVASLPDWLKNIALSVVMSSVGTILTLAFIMADARGVTHFFPWSGLSLSLKEERISIRRSVFVTAMLTFIFTLSLLVLLALQRMTGVADVQFPQWAEVLVLPLLPPLAAVAHVLIIVPMLITTALLFWGVAGIIVWYGIGVGVLRLLGIVIEGVLFLVEKIVDIIEPSSKVFSYFILILMSTVFVALGLLIGTFLIFVEGITHATTAIIEMLFYPFIVLGDIFGWGKSLIHSLLGKD